MIDETWKRYLEHTRQIEPAARRRLLMQQEAEALLKNSNDPILIAGTTASVPTTASFIKALRSHPHAALVLPGLDGDLDADSLEI